jgi:hypothetical protein
VIESYNDIARRHMQQELSLKQFKAMLEQLFKPYPDVLDLLPFLFTDVQDKHPDLVMQKVYKQLEAQ